MLKIVDKQMTTPPEAAHIVEAVMVEENRDSGGELESMKSDLNTLRRFVQKMFNQLPEEKQAEIINGMDCWRFDAYVTKD